MNNIQALADTFPEYIIDYNDLHIGKNIGHGGSSDVFVGMQISTGKMCAVKVLNTQILEGQMFTLFKREVSILVKCKNRFLLTFVGFTVVHPFTIVTEYVPNGSLYNALHSDNISSEIDGTKKTILALGIANGCKRLHKLGILHRDLKSLNVLLDADFLPHVCDFGLSRFKSETFSTDESSLPMTTNVGTPHWMAPELFEDRPYDEKVDVYAYGMMLWEILTGLSPFRGKTPMQIAYAVCNNRERPKIPLMTPAPLRDLINACWHQESSKRPSFKVIYRLFAKEKVMFSGTDEKVVQKIVSLIQHDRIIIKEKKKQKQHVLSSKVDTNSNSSQSSSLTFSASLQILSDPSNPNFKQTLTDISPKITPLNALQFFNSISTSLSSPAILETIRRLMDSNEKYIKIFVESKIHLKLPMSNISLSEQICQILLYVFTLYPDAGDNQFLDSVSSLSHYQPFKILRLFNLIITSFNEKDNTNSPNLATAAEYASNLVIKEASNYISLGAGDPFLRQIFSLIVQSKEYVESHISELKNVIMIAQSMGNAPISSLVYNIVALHPFLLNALDVDALAKHLTTKEISDSALIIVSKMKPNSKFILPLIQLSYENENAFYLLCGYADKCSIIYNNPENVDPQNYIEIMNTFLAMAEHWITKGIPTLSNTISLCIICLKDDSFKEGIINNLYFPVLFENIMKELSEPEQRPNDDMENEMIVICSLIFRKISVTSSFLSKLELNGFLSFFFQTGVKSINSFVLINTFAFAEIAARIGYSSSYLFLIPLVEALIIREKDGWYKYATSLAATLSCYKEIREEFKKRPDFIQKIEKLSEIPHLRSYVSVFLKNIH